LKISNLKGDIKKRKEGRNTFLFLLNVPRGTYFPSILVYSGTGY